MKHFRLKTSAAAVLLAFSSAAAWAGVSGDAAEQQKAQAGAAAVPQPSGQEPAEESLGWQFRNGESAAGDQAAQPQGGTQDETAATAAEQDQAATGEGAGDERQSAQSEDASADRAASDEASSGDQTAAGEEAGNEPQSAQSGDQSDEQSAQSGDSQSGDQAADSRLPADLEGKVVVIIPKDWQGSLPDLVAALRMSPDAEDIVIVQQGEPQASNDEDGDDEYFADRSKPADEEGEED